MCSPRGVVPGRLVDCGGGVDGHDGNVTQTRTEWLHLSDLIYS